MNQSTKLIQKFKSEYLIMIGRNTVIRSNKKLFNQTEIKNSNYSIGDSIAFT